MYSHNRNNKQNKQAPLTDIMRQYRQIIIESSNVERDEEGRMLSPDISYDVSTSKVVAQLKSYNSQSYTKLAQKLQRVSDLEAEVKQLRKEVKQDTRELVADLFSADDVVRTRVVETVSFIFTLSKDPKPTETIKYANVIEELEKHLTPELIVVLNDLKEKYKSVSQREPALKVEPKEQLEETMLGDMAQKLKSYFAKFKNLITRWGERYDDKLNALKEQI